MLRGPWQNLGLEEANLSEIQLPDISPLTLRRHPSRGGAQRGREGLSGPLAPAPATAVSCDVLGEARGQSLDGRPFSFIAAREHQQPSPVPVRTAPQDGRRVATHTLIHWPLLSWLSGTAGRCRRTRMAGKAMKPDTRAMPPAPSTQGRAPSSCLRMSTEWVGAVASQTCGVIGSTFSWSW